MQGVRVDIINLEKHWEFVILVFAAEQFPVCNDYSRLKNTNFALDHPSKEIALRKIA